MYCAYAEPPGHVAWQNGNRVTPKERAQLAAKVLKTIPAHCTSVEVVQDKHDAKQSTALHADPCTVAQRGGQKRTPGDSKSNFTGLNSPREREGRRMPFGEKVVKCLVSS